MVKKTITKETCHGCCVPLRAAGAIYCNGCAASRLRHILSSSAWLAWRGVSKGDRPGETLADTFRRELAEIEPVVER